MYGDLFHSLNSKYSNAYFTYFAYFAIIIKYYSAILNFPKMYKYLQSTAKCVRIRIYGVMEESSYNTFCQNTIFSRIFNASRVLLAS